MLGYQFDSSRLAISASLASSGGYGTKKCPRIESLKGGGSWYDATASTGRWKGGDGSTEHSSPGGKLTSPCSRRKPRARSVHSSYPLRIASGVAGRSALSSSTSACQSS